MQKTIARKPVGLTTEIVTITPAIAEAWLERNITNRPKSQTSIAKYSRDMAAGAWMCTGDSIKFGSDGNLIDGQHRLLACVASGYSFTSVVIYGLPDITRNVVDTGLARRAQDVMVFSGMTNTVKLASAARALLDYKNGGQLGRRAWSNSEVLSVVDRQPKLHASVVGMWKLPRGAPVSTLNFIHYVATNIVDRGNEAIKMHEVWSTGVPAYDGDPMHLFRERMMSTTIARRHAIQTLYHAWNLFQAGERLSKLPLRTSDVRIADLKDRDL